MTLPKIVVTGGAGFIGCNLVLALNRAGEEDILVVDEPDVDLKRHNLSGLRFKDYVDKDVFRAGFKAGRLGVPEVVFHLGACSSTTEADADYLADNNYRYSRELCEWCLRNGVRYIGASSAATYGDGSLGYSDRDDVTPTLRPLNPYGVSKQMFDTWALRAGLFDRIVGLKYFNVYGPREYHKGDMRSVVHKAFQQVRDTGQVRLFKSCKPQYGHGEQVRDFIYVRDAVAVTAWFRDHPDVSGLFNCGTGRARTWNDLAVAVFSAMGRPVKIEYIDMPEELREQYQYHTEADMTKLREAGYSEPFTTLEEGIRDYVQNYLLREEERELNRR